MCLIISFWFHHKPTRMTPPSVNDRPAASAAPATPIAGRPHKPNTKPYSSGMFTTFTNAPTYSGVHASPAARSAPPMMKFAANATLKIDSQRMFDAASSTVCASSPKIDATWLEKNTPGNGQHEPEHAAEHQRRDGDASGFDFVVAAPRPRDQRGGSRTDRHHHGLQREEHALPGADCRERFGTELPDDFRLHETNDAVQQVAENRRQRELQDARALVRNCVAASRLTVATLGPPH